MSLIESISGAVTHYLLGAVQALQSVLALFWPFRATFPMRHFFQPNGCAKVEEEIRKFVAHLIPQHFPKGELLSSTFIVIHNGSRIVKQTSFEGISCLWSPFVVLI